MPDGGAVVVIARKATERDQQGPPWLLTEEEVRYFGVDGVELAVLETLPMEGGTRWRAELRRPLSGTPGPATTSHQHTSDCRF